MVRLNLSREQKAKKRRMVGMTTQLGNITHFSDITALTGRQTTVSGRKRQQTVP